MFSTEETNVSDIGTNTDSFLNWLNQALVNRHEEICDLSNKWTTSDSTFSSKGYELSLPSNWDNTSTIVLYTDSDMQNEEDRWETKFGVIRFDQEQSAGTKYYFRYRQQPTIYTAMGETLSEADNPRLKKILMEETIALFLQSEEDLEMSSAMSNMFNNADKSS